MLHCYRYELVTPQNFPDGSASGLTGPPQGKAGDAHADEPICAKVLFSSLSPLSPLGVHFSRNEVRDSRSISRGKGSETRDKVVRVTTLTTRFPCSNQGEIFKKTPLITRT